MDTPKPGNPAATLSAGYASSADPKAARRRRSLAATYRPDPGLDWLLALRDRDPAAYARAVDPATRIALGIYQAAQAAHEEVQRDSNS